jgi:hypothetical protein
MPRGMLRRPPPPPPPRVARVRARRRRPVPALTRLPEDAALEQQRVKFMAERVQRIKASRTATGSTAIAAAPATSSSSSTGPTVAAPSHYPGYLCRDGDYPIYCGAMGGLGRRLFYVRPLVMCRWVREASAEWRGRRWIYLRNKNWDHVLLTHASCYMSIGSALHTQRRSMEKVVCRGLHVECVRSFQRVVSSCARNGSSGGQLVPACQG